MRSELEQTAYTRAERTSTEELLTSRGGGGGGGGGGREGEDTEVRREGFLRGNCPLGGGGGVGAQLLIWKPFEDGLTRFFF